MWFSSVRESTCLTGLLGDSLRMRRWTTLFSIYSSKVEFQVSTNQNLSSPFPLATLLNNSFQVICQKRNLALHFTQIAKIELRDKDHSERNKQLRPTS